MAASLILDKDLTVGLKIQFLNVYRK